VNRTTVITTGEKKLLARAAAMTRQSLFTNAGYLLGINAVGSLVGFVFWGLAARLYRPEDVGTASAVLSAVALVSGIARLGMEHGLVRFLPESQSPRRTLNTAFTSSILAAVLMGAVFLVGLPLWSPSLVTLQQNGWYTAIFLIYVAAATLGTVVQMAFVARRRAIYALLHTCVINGGRLILVILLADLGASGLVASVALAFSVAVAVSLWGFLPSVEPGYRTCIEVSWHDLAILVPYSLGNHVASLLVQIPQIVLPLLILELVGPASSGHAYVALMIGGLLTSPGLALASSAFAESANAPQRSLSILTKATVLGLALTVSAGVIVGIAAPWLLRLFGQSYAQEASGLLRWLTLGAPLKVLSGLYFTHLRLEKQIGHLILLSTITAAATLGVSAVLMPHLGIAASGLGLLVGNGLVTASASARAVKKKPN